MFKSLADNPLLLVVLILLIVVVFGAKRLPDAARSLGRSMRIFKSEVKEMKDDGKSTAAPGSPSRPLEGRVLGDDAHTPAAEHPAPGADSQRHGV